MFDALENEARHAYDKIVSLELSDVSVDGSLRKNPCGGEETGKNPTDRSKLGWKWSILTYLNGIPIGRVIDGANRNDSVMLVPILDDAAKSGPLIDIETLWLDRVRERIAERNINGVIIAKGRKRGAPKTKKSLPVGLRWPVEQINSWLSNFSRLAKLSRLKEPLVTGPVTNPPAPYYATKLTRTPKGTVPRRLSPVKIATS